MLRVDKRSRAAKPKRWPYRGQASVAHAALREIKAVFSSDSATGTPIPPCAIECRELDYLWSICLLTTRWLTFCSEDTFGSVGSEDFELTMDVAKSAKRDCDLARKKWESHVSQHKCISNNT
jgi:hypothetical protein